MLAYTKVQKPNAVWQSRGVVYSFSLCKVGCLVAFTAAIGQIRDRLLQALPLTAPLCSDQRTVVKN